MYDNLTDLKSFLKSIENEQIEKLSANQTEQNFLNNKEYDFEKLKGVDGPLAEINGRLFTKPPEIDHAEFGLSFSPKINVKIPVNSEGNRWNNYIGKTVKNVYFRDYNDFVFKVRFSCNLPKYKQYINPYSFWFNVFFGYYQVDVNKNEWKRPFAYSESNSLLKEDIIRLGKADWNYFSNMMYGVPEKYIESCRNISDEELNSFVYKGRNKINNYEWDFVELDMVKVISAYLAKDDNKQLDELLINKFWRDFFVKSKNYKEEGVYDYNTSFIPTLMKAQFFMCYTEDKHEYHTFFFGGTINKLYDSINQDLNNRFLKAQMDSIKKVLNSKDFENLGFK